MCCVSSIIQYVPGTGTECFANKNRTAHSNIENFILPGKTLKDDLSLQQIGIQAGSSVKAILMHSSGYKMDQGAMDTITKLNQELDLLELTMKGEAKGDATGNAKHISKAAATHLITDICCKLDSVDVSGSETLREIRRKVLRRAERLDELWES